MCRVWCGSGGSSWCGLCGLMWPWRRWRARKGLLGVELHIVVKGLERLVGESVGELLVDLLSNDCVSLRTQRKTGATAC